MLHETITALQYRYSISLRRHGLVAQWLAHWTSNSKVEGSSPFKVSSFALRSIVVSLHVKNDS